MDCISIPELSYGEFSERIHVGKLNQRILLGASLDVTERCNLRCAHCYINRPAADRTAQQKELSFKEWAVFLDEMAGEGCLWLQITGGEPLLRSDFRDIYLHAKNRGMIITLFTNGTLLTPELADFLQDYPPFAVEITIYGRTKAVYEAVTRVPGSYKQCLRSIDLLLNRNISMELKTMVMTLNVHELQDMKSWAQGLGVQFRYDAELNPRLDGGRDPLALRLSPEEVVDLDVRDEVRLQERERVWKDFGGADDPDHLYICNAGKYGCHLDAYGQMYICMMDRHLGYDLRRGSLREGWLEFIPRLRRQKPRPDYHCGRCKLIKFCDQCPGWASLECGDPEASVAFLCRIAHLRAEKIGILPKVPTKNKRRLDYGNQR